MNLQYKVVVINQKIEDMKLKNADSVLSQFFRQKLPLIGLKNGSDLLTYPLNCAGTYRVRRRLSSTSS